MTQPSDYMPPYQPAASGRQPLRVVPTADQPGADAARLLEAARIADAARIRALEDELASTRAELEQLQQLLTELPGIFERKFQQRLEPVLQQQLQLQEENAGMRDQMRQLPPGPAPVAPAPAPAWTMRSEPNLLMPSLPPRAPIRIARPRNESADNRPQGNSHRF